jgi:hypothetical protein
MKDHCFISSQPWLAFIVLMLLLFSCRSQKVVNYLPYPHQPNQNLEGAVWKVDKVTAKGEELDLRFLNITLRLDSTWLTVWVDKVPYYQGRYALKDDSTFNVFYVPVGKHVENDIYYLKYDKQFVFSHHLISGKNTADRYKFNKEGAMYKEYNHALNTFSGVLTKVSGKYKILDDEHLIVKSRYPPPSELILSRTKTKD